jgi:transposase
MFATRLAHKARGRVEKVSSAYTSQRCSRCGTVDREARESQAAFRCRCCGYRANADHNAARNIAAGHAARGGLALAEPTNREPQLVASWVK